MVGSRAVTMRAPITIAATTANWRSTARDPSPTVGWKTATRDYANGVSEEQDCLTRPGECRNTMPNESSTTPSSDRIAEAAADVS